MESTSPFLLMKKLETLMNGTLSAIDIYALPQGKRMVITDLRRELTDTRLDIRDYELSETREAQVRCAKAARRRINKIQKSIVTASEYNMFGAADVAQYTAQLEHISEQLL